MKTVVIDWDDVLFPTVFNVVKLYNEQFKDTLLYTDIDKWDLSNRFPKSTKDVMDLFSEVNFLDISIYEGVIESLHKLNAVTKTYVCTATTFDYVDTLRNKFQAFQQYFTELKPNQFMAFPDKHLIDADYFIDDNPNLADRLLNHPKAQMLMVNRPWNASNSCALKFNDFNLAVDYILKDVSTELK